MYESVPIAPSFGESGSPIHPEVLTPEMLRFVTSDVGRNLSTMRAFYESYALRDGEGLLAVVDDILAVLRRELSE